MNFITWLLLQAREELQQDLFSYLHIRLTNIFYFQTVKLFSRILWKGDSFPCDVTFAATDDIFINSRHATSGQGV
jgi:hypothetical protein